MDEELKTAWQKIKTERDELLLQIHLAKAELKEEWEETLEPRWNDIQKKIGDAVDQSEEVAGDIQEGLVIAAEELGAAYRRIRARLKD